ncbi:hypothetical protein PQX77_019526 [Marasmius sp. AFHP31]|nr:hypothetical protein PQX77_019526 [Marasmius sp. AFHP31]
MSYSNILLTGGTGQTATALAQRLLSRTDAHLILTSRKGAGSVPSALSSFDSKRVKTVRFDWDDSSTLSSPFDDKIDAVYLVPHHSPGSVERTKTFIDLALENGVKRFVMLGSSAVEIDGPGPGKFHKLLEDVRQSGKLKEYAVLRPSWFFTNLATQYAPGIISSDHVVSAAGDGKYGWVSVEDIAEAAFSALTVPAEELYREYIITGPELLNLDEVADVLSEILFRKITHVRLSESESMERVPQEHAQMMTQLDIAISNGLEERTFALEDTEPGKLKRWIGKESFKDFISANTEAWKK